MRYEWKKLICRKEAVILFGLIVVFLGICIARFERPQLAKQIREEMKRYDGEYTEVRQQLEENYQQAMKTENAGIIGTPEYNRVVVLSSLLTCVERYDRYFEERRQTLKELQGKIDTAPTDYIKADYEKAYRAYNCAYSFRVIDSDRVMFTFFEIDEDSFDFVFLAFLLAFFSGLFVCEQETKMHLLLYPSKRGKKRLFRNKTGAAVLAVAVAAVFFTAVTFLGTWIRNGLSFRILSEPIQCVKQFELCPYAITVFGYLLITIGLHFLVGLFVLSVIVFCSSFLKRSLTVFVASGIPVLGLAVLGKGDRLAEVTSTLDKFGLLQLLDEGKYLVSYDTVNIMGVPVDRIVPALAFTVVCSAVLLLLAYGGYVGMFRKGER